MYDLGKYGISLSLLSKLNDNDKECAIQHASSIVDFFFFFLHYYDTYPEQSVQEIVNYLCTFFFLQNIFLVRLVLYMSMFYTRLRIRNIIICDCFSSSVNFFGSIEDYLNFWGGYSFIHSFIHSFIGHHPSILKTTSFFSHLLFFLSFSLGHLFHVSSSGPWFSFDTFFFFF